MSRYWSNDYFMRDNLPATMAAVVGVDYDGQASFESFEHFRGLDEAIVVNLEEVVREVFGSRFKAIHSYNAKNGLRVHVHHARRDCQKASLGVDFRIEYGGILDWLVQDYNPTTSMLSHVFSQIVRKMRARLAVQYPEAQVGMTHRYAHKRQLSLQFEVICAPRMQFAVAA